MIIFDAHLDLAWNALDWNRDLEWPVQQIRESEDLPGVRDLKGRACNTVSLPEMRRGGVGICIATLLPRLLRQGSMPPLQRYTSMDSAYAAAYGQIAWYRAMVAKGAMRWITDAVGLREHVEAYLKDENEPIGFILSMEGADPVLSPEQVWEWHEAGLRIIGPTHYGVSPYGHGTGTEGGLIGRGPDLLREMAKVGIILDVTHLSDQCFDEAMEIYDGPVLASHHNCRALVPHQRQLTDDQIKRLIERGGVIGTALDAWMLYPAWERGTTSPAEAGVTLETMADHIDHVCQLAGNAEHAAIGTDLDGGFGTEQTPSDLDTIADLRRVPEILKKRGYDDEAIEGIMYKNWLRFFHKAWKK